MSTAVPSSDFKNALESEAGTSENLTSTMPSNPSIQDESRGEQTPEASDQTKNVSEDKEGVEEDEEETGECGFCLFMKGGGCKESFTAWENCIEDAEKTGEDIVNKCFELTSLLKKCMEAHSDYYEPVLRAEKAAQEELDREAALRDSEQNKEDGDPVKEEAEQNKEDGDPVKEEGLRDSQDSEQIKGNDDRERETISKEKS